MTLGPATNLAVAVLREPELPLLLRRWVLMGGSYRSPGNTAPTTEWNASVDPDALKVCIAAFGQPSVVERRLAAGLAGLPLALGLDVTERAKMLPDHVTALARRAGSRPGHSRGAGGGAAGAGGGAPGAGSTASHPVVRYVDDALRFYMEFHSRYDGFYGAFIHDPLAVAAALDPGAGPHRGARRRRGAGRDAHHRRDGGRLAPHLGAAADARRCRRGGRGDLLRAVRRAGREPGERIGPG